MQNTLLYSLRHRSFASLREMYSQFSNLQTFNSNVKYKTLFCILCAAAPLRLCEKCIRSFQI